MEERTELISRQAAIDAVADLYWMDERLLNFKKEIDATFDKIKALPSAQQWIPCSERLPEKDMTRYLCTYNYSEGVCVDFGFYSEGAWFTTGVTAWMPLPEPYKAERSEE